MTIMERTIRFAHEARALRPLMVGLLALSAFGCDDILEVNDPDIVTPESLVGDVGIETVFAGAIGDFDIAYDGGCCGGSFIDNVVTSSGYMSDELYVSGTFPTRQEFDQRDVDDRNTTLRAWFHNMQRARVSLENAANRLEETFPDDSRVGELLSLAGFTYVSFAENFCSGVPFSRAPAEGPLEFGEPLTTAEVLDTAITRFTSALAEAGTDADVQALANVGLARAHLFAGNRTQAAAAAAAVPDDFRYLIFNSTNSSRQYNGFFSSNAWTRRSSISNNEGEFGTGLPFRAENDPRVPWAEDPRGGFDGESPQFNLLEYGGFGIPLSRSAEMPLATGVEARLIEAEADLSGGTTAGSAAAGNWLQILNDLRSDIGLAALTDPGAPEARVDLLFKERAFWLYATGHRLADMRRLIKHYNRAENDVFPHGNYFKVGDYGSDVNFPIPFEEENNEKFTGCIDRSA